jgi:uncharacterized protein YneF (UPF0154 family)
MKDIIIVVVGAVILFLMIFGHYIAFRISSKQDNKINCKHVSKMRLRHINKNNREFVYSNVTHTITWIILFLMGILTIFCGGER